MDVSCLQETLNKGLSVVGRAVANRTTLPITQNVLIATDQGRLRLTATNLEVAISTWIGSTVQGRGGRLPCPRACSPILWAHCRTSA